MDGRRSTSHGEARRLTPTDAGDVGPMARRIWTACYVGMIPARQIEYMLARMYARTEILAQMERGIVWEWWLSRGAPIGFMAWEGPGPEGWLRLHKLYLDPAWHGQGKGQAMLRHVAAQGRERAARGVELRVNKANHQALRAYHRAGYRVVESLCEEIGGGFVMDDHRMRVDLAPADAVGTRMDGGLSAGPEKPPAYPPAP